MCESGGGGKEKRADFSLIRYKRILLQPASIRYGRRKM